MKQRDFDELAEGIRQAGKTKRGETAASRALAMIDWHRCPEVERTPDRVSGAWVFRGTRVPVRALFENLKDGASLDDFLEWFPGVTRAQAETVLRTCAESLDDASDGRTALERLDKPEGWYSLEDLEKGRDRRDER